MQRKYSGVAALVEGMDINEVIKRLKMVLTAMAGELHALIQLAIALEQYLEQK